MRGEKKGEWVKKRGKGKGKEVLNLYAESKSQSIVFLFYNKLTKNIFNRIFSTKQTEP